jgi:hypothetical protein
MLHPSPEQFTFPISHPLRGGISFMRKFTISALLFPVLLGLTVPVGSQTRPRRVNQLTDTSVASNSEVRPSAALNSEVRTQERSRATTERPRAAREGTRQGSRWPGLLLSTGLAIGASRIGHGSSCSPSRGAILGGLFR